MILTCSRLDYALHSNDEYMLFSTRIRPAGANGPGTRAFAQHLRFPLVARDEARWKGLPDVDSPLTTVTPTEGSERLRSKEVGVRASPLAGGSTVISSFSYVASPLGAAGGAARRNTDVRARQPQMRAR